MENESSSKAQFNEVEEAVQVKTVLKQSPSDAIVDGSDTNLNTDIKIDSRYEIQALVGQGGMGAVYKAFDKVSGQHVAIKFLNSELTKDNAARKRFEQEVQSLSGLDHENIVSLFGQGQTADGTPYLVMQLVDGQSLQQILKDSDPIAPLRAIAIMKQVYQGLAHAHERGMIHRDLKPSNIMITAGPGSDDVVRILDFGIASIVEGTTGKTTNFTQTSDVFGTPTYMSPEQCEGKALDARSDIYSSGCLFYELIAGRPPFQGQNPIQVAVQHLKDEPAKLTIDKKNPGKKQLQNIETLVLNCLAKNPSHRYSSVRQVLEQVNAVEKGTKITSLTSNGVRSKLIVSDNFMLVLILFLLFTSSSFYFYQFMQATQDQVSRFPILSLFFVFMSSWPFINEMLSTRFAYRALRSLNRTFKEFWNFAQSLSLLLAISAFVLLHVANQAFEFYLGKNVILSDILAALSGSLLLLSILIAITLGILMLFCRKQLDGPISGKALIKHVGITSGASLAVVLASFMLFPKVMAVIPSALGIGLDVAAPSASINCLKTAIWLGLDSDWLYDEMTQTCSRIGKDADALATIDQAIVRKPTIERYKLRSNALANLGRNKDAIADLTSAIAMKRLPALLARRADIYAREGQFEKAIEDYTSAIAEGDLNPDFLEKRGSIYAAILSEYPKAISDFEIPVSTRVQVSDQLRLAIALELNGDEKAARQAYTTVVRSDSAGLTGPGIVAYAQKKLGNTAEYQKLLTQYKDLKSSLKPQENINDIFTKQVFGNQARIRLPLE